MGLGSDQFPEIYVLRHGQTEWNVEGRHQGRLDSPLTQLGREQAVDQGKILKTQDRDWSEFDVFCSPQGRAMATAELVGAQISRVAAPDDLLCEVSFGAWEGLNVEEIEAEWPELAGEGGDFGWHFLAPAGESFEELATRARCFLMQLTKPSVIVTHGITSRVLRGLWLGLDADAMGEIGGGQGNVYHLKDGKQTQFRLSQNLTKFAE